MGFRTVWIDEVEGKSWFCIGTLDDVMSLEVFEAEEDWSCACISVRNRCLFDIISIAYARFTLLAWNYVESVFGSSRRLLEATWRCFDNFLRPLEPILGSLGRPSTVLVGLGGLLAQLLEYLGASCDASWGVLRKVFGVGFLIDFLSFVIENCSKLNKNMIAQTSWIINSCSSTIM